MKKRTVFIFVASILFATSCGLPEETNKEAKEALNALQELKSRVGMGTNYLKYRDLVSDAKVELDQFNGSSQADKHEAYQNLQNAFKHYNNASRLWDCSLQHVDSQYEPVEIKDCSFISEMKQTEQYEIDFFRNVSSSVEDDAFYYIDAVDVMWKKAAQSVELAVSNFK